MPSLKSKNISSSRQTEAASLPQFMQSLHMSEMAIQIPLDQLMEAPPEWNFYRPLSDEKLYELAQSIKDNGLLHPIVVWRREDGSDVILSGHNRVRAYRALYQETKNGEYLTIAANLREDLDEDTAREIIVDSNWVQRTLTTTERTKSIYQKYVLLGRKKRSQPTEEGYERSYDIIAKKYNLSGKQIQRYIKLNSLLPEYLKMIDEGSITLRSGLKLAEFDEDMQGFMLPLVSKDFDNKAIAALNKRMDYKAAAAIFAGQAEKQTVSVTVEVPVEMKDEFLRMAREFLSGAPTGNT